MSTYAQIVRELSESKSDLETIIAQLKSQGASQQESIKALISGLEMDSSEANRSLMVSAAWKEENERGDFFDSLDDEFD